MNRFFENLRKNKLVKWSVSYAIGSWAILQVLGFVFPTFDLPASALRWPLYILIAIFPLWLLLGYFYRGANEQADDESGVAQNAAPGKKKNSYLNRIVTVVVVALLLMVAFVYGLRLHHRGTVEKKLAVIKQLAVELQEAGSVERGLKAWEVYQMVKEIEETGAAHSELMNVWMPVSRTFVFRCNVNGASVSIMPYSKAGASWIRIGQTPIDSIRLPIGSLRIKIQKEGYAIQEDAIPDRTMYEPDKRVDMDFRLVSPGTIPEGMVLAHSDTTEQYDNGAHCEEFFIDRYEVTNRAYKKFVDAGGYRDPKYWKFKFLLKKQELNWQKAIEHFVDKTGQPGPSTWVVGQFPAGEEDFPVRGVSWYEAAAFAEFTGKTLPRVAQFWNLSMPLANAEILRSSNIQKTGVKRTDESGGIARFGTVAMVGNVREWMYNEVEGSDHRIILGGAWNDNVYAYGESPDLSPFDRTETNGFRCLREIGKLDTSLSLPIRNFVFDMSKRKVMTDAQFEIVRHLYDYEPRPLAGKVVRRDDSRDWTRELVKIPAAYDLDTLLVYIYLPKKATPPFQQVIFSPGLEAYQPIPSLEFLPEEEWRFSFMITTGRAVIYPVFKGTLDRYDPAWSALNYQSPRDGLIGHKEVMIKIGKDIKRTVDYLRTRNDLDSSRLGYDGFSQGGSDGALIMAIEKRLKIGVFAVCGISTRIEVLPEIDRVNYLPRVRQPVLILNSRYDWNYPYEIAQKPFLDLLGTRPEDRRLILFEESGHQIPWHAVIKETLNWYDEHWGKPNMRPLEKD